MVKTVMACIIFVIIIVALGAVLVYLYNKYSVYREFKAKVVDVSNHVMIINTFEPGMWGVIICEDEDGHSHCFTTNLSISDKLIKGQDYIFVTCNDKLIDVRNVE